MAATEWLSPEQYRQMYPDPQAGPCLGCGAENYSLSMGGPGICPACDSTPPERRVRQLAEENRALRKRVTELEAHIRPPAPERVPLGWKSGDPWPRAWPPGANRLEPR